MWEWVGLELGLIVLTLYFWERNRETEGFIVLTASLFLGYLVSRAAAAAGDAVTMYAAAMLAFMAVLLFAARIANKVVGVRL